MTPRLLYVVTHGMTARYLLLGQFSAAKSRGYTVAVACAPGSDLDHVAERDGVDVLAVPFAREIDAIADARTLWSLSRRIADWRPDVVVAATPKAGLLGMAAARLVGVPVRLLHQYGLRYETATGVKRTVLMAAERVAAACAHEVIAVAPSLRDRIVADGLAPAGKVRVLGAGTSNGVDAGRFGCPDPAAVVALRARLGLDGGAPVIGFVGRFTKDKGIAELVEALALVWESLPEARLLLVGDFEDGDPVRESVRAHIESDSRIVTPGFLQDPAPAYALMDVLAFPSHREGFPNVPLEAAAAGLPVVGARATGTVDAVFEGETGALVPVGDAPAMAEALMRYLSDEALRQHHGAAGRRRVKAQFSNEIVWSSLFDEIDRLLDRTPVVA